MKLIYCFDAYCSVCYGFSAVMKQIFNEYQRQFQFEVISGGMIRPEQPAHISLIANHIKGTYKKVESLSGIKFGTDFLWHIHHPGESDWYPESVTPAIALSIFRDYYHDLEVLIASDIQKALFEEGRDLTDPEAYRHLIEKYPVNEAEFFEKLKSEEYKEKAEYDFALTKQLRVAGFPTVFLQVADLKFYMVAKGFTSYEDFKRNIESVMGAIKQ